MKLSQKQQLLFCTSRDKSYKGRAQGDARQTSTLFQSLHHSTAPDNPTKSRSKRSMYFLHRWDMCRFQSAFSTDFHYVRCARRVAQIEKHVTDSFTDNARLSRNTLSYACKRFSLNTVSEKNVLFSRDYIFRQCKKVKKVQLTLEDTQYPLYYEKGQQVYICLCYLEKFARTSWLPVESLPAQESWTTNF